jgi:hypothetical protein
MGKITDGTSANVGIYFQKLKLFLLVHSKISKQFTRKRGNSQKKSSAYRHPWLQGDVKLKPMPYMN